MRFSLLFVLLLGAVAAWAQQSNNNGLHAVPVPGKVAIDGKLDDWDLSGQIDVYANYRTHSSYSAKVAAMYDKENFYLAVLWRDPTPMYNMVDSNFDIGSGWKSDCLQLRLKTDMVIGDVSCWYSTAAKHAVINIAYGRFSGGRDREMDIDAFHSVVDALKIGAQEAFLMGADGKSYAQEIALPWKLITGQNAIVRATGKPYKAPKTYGPGDTFNMGMEFLWGPADGRTFPIHRYADLLMPGKSNREFFWTAENDWGPVTLEPKGRLNLPKNEVAASVAYRQTTVGPVKLNYTMPYDGFVTLVIDNEKGHRVKNLVGMAPRSKGKQTEFWDGTDEDGKLVAPGKYTWRGLYHQGIDPVYAASYGTAGVPPWDTGDGTGAWLSDHTSPVAVAAGKEVMVIASHGSEAGWALVGTDLNGRRKWGERKFQGLSCVAADDAYAYAGEDIAAWAGILVPKIGRLELATGKYAPFTSTPPQLEVPVATAEEKARLTGVAAGPDTLAVALAGLDKVRVYDKQTMAFKAEFTVPTPGGVAYAGGTLYALSGTQVVKVGATLTPVVTRGITDPAGLAVDARGRFYVTERGTHQVLVFGADGAFSHVIGTKGGRPYPGKWDPQGMRNPHGLAIDAQDRVWVAEDDMWPKRVSVWRFDGQLVRDYIGPTTYGGMGAVADPADPTRVFGNGCEFKLDIAKNTAVPVASLLAGNLAGELLKINGREYYMSKDGWLYLRKGDALVPVARMGMLNARDMAKSTVPVTPPAGVRDWFSYLWCDRNDDNVMTAEEITTTTTLLNGGYWGGYWLDEAFNIYSGPGGYSRQTVTKVPQKGFTPGGAPLWDLAAKQQIADWAAPGPNKLYLATKGTVIVGTPMTCFADDGTRLWSYSRDNWNDVHGSHMAPIPERDDQFVGVLSCIGTATSPVGKLFAMNSNMGRLHVMTTDGLLAATVFQDCRIGPDAWPTDAKAGAPMGGVTMGGEWFGGYFYKSEKTNAYYLIAGGTSYNLIELRGMAGLTALPAKALTFTGKDLLAAERLQQQKAAAAASAQTLTITRFATAPKLDSGWDKYPPARRVEWRSGPYAARGALAADADNLYVAVDVSGDTNPMVNGGKDATMLFITGDCVDLQLGTNAAADPKRGDAVVGDIRVSISVLDGKPVATLYRFKAAGGARPQVFSSPWRKFSVDNVDVIADARVVINRRGDGYTLEAALPLKALGFAPQPGAAYRCDLGIILSDPTGTNRAARVYWANKATGLVNDVPGEIMPTPQLWGTAVMEK
jgi:hypothetical protein